MLHAELSTAIAPPWSEMDPILLGGPRTDPRQQADLIVTVTEDARPLLRADIYRNPRPECFAFQQAVAWNRRIYVGYGECVYVIDPGLRRGGQIFLSGSAGYFGAFYAAPGHLLVATGESLVRLTQDGGVLWIAAGLGLDGVIVDGVENGVIHGHGEWDPPGGWKPFALRLDSGYPLRPDRPQPPPHAR